MKSNAMRWMVAAGAACVAVAFFLPRETPQSSCYHFKFMCTAAEAAKTPAEAAMFGVLSLLVLYPFAWAASVLLVRPGKHPSRWTGKAWPHLLIHTAGGLLAIGISLVLLSLGDPWIPRKLQWTGVTAPVILLSILWLIGRRLPPDRRAWAVIATGFAYLLLLMVLLTLLCHAREEPVWGFAIGGSGSLLAAIGAAVLAAVRRTPRAEGH